MRQIVLCTTCKFSPESRTGPDGRTGGETLIDHVNSVLQKRDPSSSVQTQPCLWNCAKPCSVVFRDTERFTYVTGGHEPTREQAEAIVAWFELHGATEDGQVPFKQWPDRMRGHFIARVPKV
jgi:predicted metal-binding protein